MRTLDWIVLALTLLSIILYGLYKGRGKQNLAGYLLADRKMRWYTVALSIMATQASAVTFTSTPGQAYVDGMRFVQFYLGLPVAMVILSITAVPLYHKLGVYTAYEYLEHRFDLKTRTLTAIIFLVQRGLGVGITIYAPSLVLSVMLGWDIRLTSTLIGGIIIIYTTSGGVKAVNWTDFQQMLIILFGMTMAFVMTIALLPEGIGFVDALKVAGGMGKLNAIDFSFDLQNRYTFWSGLVGGMFVALAYFGTDQSQVQRYLTGASVTQSRLGLLFNGLAKVPMQFFILLIGAMVFVFFQFVRPPLFFNPVEVNKVRHSAYANQYDAVEIRYGEVAERKTATAREYIVAKRQGNPEDIRRTQTTLASLSKEADAIRAEGIGVIKANDPSVDPNDTNYIFLTFVMTYLPVGLVGLVFACIFAASMSSTSGELSALATCSIVDVYRRHIRKNEEDKHYVLISRMTMAAWGVYAVIFAQYASRLGSLIEAVNILGSLFYGTMLAIFLIAFYMKWIGGTATFCAAFAGEGVVLSCYLFTSIPWLWYNVIGCGVVVGVAVLLQLIVREPAGAPRPG
jgi:solute:Na+ symporter, SSS family